MNMVDGQEIFMLDYHWDSEVMVWDGRIITMDGLGDITITTILMDTVVIITHTVTTTTVAIITQTTTPTDQIEEEIIIEQTIGPIHLAKCTKTDSMLRGMIETLIADKYEVTEMQNLSPTNHYRLVLQLVEGIEVTPLLPKAHLVEHLQAHLVTD